MDQKNFRHKIPWYFFLKRNEQEVQNRTREEQQMVLDLEKVPTAKSTILASRSGERKEYEEERNKERKPNGGKELILPDEFFFVFEDQKKKNKKTKMIFRKAIKRPERIASSPLFCPP